MPDLAPIEKEAALLFAARKLIKEMVNCSMLSIGGNYSGMSLLPQTSQSAKLFSIHLIDFISSLGNPFPKNLTMLSGLWAITENPLFDHENSIDEFREAVHVFDTWLGHEAAFDNIWLPSIGKELSVTATRKELIKICGNIAKHHVWRLNNVVERILKILRNADPNIERENAFAAMDDFYAYFHDNILHYHFTKVSEMLNNIAWGIQAYLEPEFRRVYKIDPEKSVLNRLTAYRYEYPEGIKSELGKSYYWELMNEIRSKPIIPRFKTSQFLLLRY